MNDDTAERISPVRSKRMERRRRNPVLREREKAQLYCGGDPLRGNPGGFTPAGRGQGVGLPYYRSTFVRKKGRYYYADNDLPFLVAESENPRVIGGKTTNYYMLEVTYWKDRISFA